MRTFYTSDLHIGHRLAAEERGFASPADHDAELAKRWDAVVKPGDRVCVLGDISLGGKANTLRALEWIDDRPGTKELIAGNHDECHPMRSRAVHWKNLFEVSAFASVQHAATHKIAGQRVMLSHFPFYDDPDGDHTPENRFPEWRVPDVGQWLLHGHTHSSVAVRGRQLHVGVDAHNLTPVPQRWVAEQIQPPIVDLWALERC
ncbi:metallophosphoesterase [Nocardia asteroides]|uniref:metallophosphoesterase n=1 Tax=Nocardia asteroides TaxID=1824 RepID=UPI0037C9848F